MKRSTIPTCTGNIFFLGLVVWLLGSEINGYSPNATTNSSLRNRPKSRRRLVDHYYEASPAELGAADPKAAIANPLKGLYSSPRFYPGDIPKIQEPNKIQDTIEFYYVGLDEIMLDLDKFDWSVLDNTIAGAVARDKHVAWRIVCHFPGDDQDVRLPAFLMAPGSTGGPVPLKETTGHGLSPIYDHPRMLRAMENFIKAFGGKYDDDDKPIAFIQLGLLGFWGEWHVRGETGILNEATRTKVIQWYTQAFTKIQLVVRFPIDTAMVANVGLHDDNFAFLTLYKGLGGKESDYFWPLVQNSGYTNFWKKSMMTGETNPSLQGTIFEAGFPTLDIEPANKQDFMECVTVTHTSAMMHHKGAFDDMMSGDELNSARNAHANMGYNFQVISVRAFTEGTTSGTVNFAVAVEQTGVAPFYHPLSLVVSCPGTNKSQNGVEQLKEKGMTKVFNLAGFPATAGCLGEVTITLKSSFVKSAKPIKFAQATKGNKGAVVLKVNLPSPTAPTTAQENPTPSTKAPGPAPTTAPTKRPCFFRRFFNRLFGWL